jgi:ABC-2 type transport system permease protein
LILLGGVFTSIGLFTSSLGKNQIIAFTLSVFLCFLSFSAFDSISKLIVFQNFENSITGLGINQHYQSISRGVLDSRDFIYFLSFAGLFLLFTKTVLGARKW